ncbi:MAG: fibronectin type III domain-containing protein, partial [Candidatus Omnitrophica bacterium]|nr:fibronectin type III domain-containing protein [Candidatus Omnitrophota bacterium]
TSRWYYYPSIAVNSNSDAGIGFSGSSTSEYAGAYYTARQSSDTTGTMQSVAALKTGLASYYKTYSGTENRWGDYSATCIDPDDDLRFWTLQEYASTPAATGTDRDRWGTWWGTFALSPTAPSGLSASAALASQIDLSWTDNSSNETGFRIERKTGASGTYSEIATPTANTTTYNDTGLSESTTYYYRVRAYNASGNSSYSNEANALTLAAAPSGLSGTAASASQIDLTWVDNSSGETGFRIERKAGAGGTYSEIAILTSDTTTYSDTGLSESTTYYYRVRAYNASGNSSYSDEANAATPASSSGGGGGGGGGCFIATAAFGTPMAPEVLVLSKFRDEHLLTNPAGRVMVSTYYKVSPSIAAVIKESPALRKITSALLRPVVWGAKNF